MLKLKKIWTVGLFLLGLGVIAFVSKRQLINPYFSTVKLQFLTNYTKSHYLYDISEVDGLESMCEGYLGGLDNRVTYYLEEDELKAAKVYTKGDYFGTGLKLMWSLDSQSLIVVDVVKNSMAEHKKIQVGDLITEIDGIRVSLSNRQKVINKVGSYTSQSISYVIESNGESRTIQLVPSEVSLEDINLEVIQDCLYMKINTIKEGTSFRMKEILDQMDLPAYKGLILDVRDLNTQQMDEIAQISDLFLENGIAFKVQTKIEGVKVYEMNPGAYKLPMVIITNGDTLGGAEALVLALNERATLLGSDTGGLFYTQHIIEFEDGTGMSVASGKICDRYGNQLKEEGVIPDIRLYLDEEDQLTKLQQGYLTWKQDHYLQQALLWFQ